MSKSHNHLIKERIQALVDEKKLTQKQLADIIGVDQPAVHKKLKYDDESNNFTMEQICKIAEHFDLTLDELIYGHKPTVPLNALKICQAIVQLFEHFEIRIYKKAKLKDIYFPPPTGFEFPQPQEVISDYALAYFPNYIMPPDDMFPEEYDEVEHDLRMGGNRCEQNVKINEFINHYLPTYHDYFSGRISFEQYESKVASYLNLIGDEAKRNQD